MRNGGNVTDNGEFETNGLKSAHGRFATRARSFDQHFHFFKTVTHGLAGGVLCHHLRSVSCALTRAFESDFPGAGPSDDVALHVGNGDDRVVKRGQDVRNAVVNVLASLCFDDLWLIDDVGATRKILRRRSRRRRRGFFLIRLGRGFFLRLGRSCRDDFLGRLGFLLGVFWFRSRVFDFVVRGFL